VIFHILAKHPETGSPLAETGTIY